MAIINIYIVYITENAAKNDNAKVKLFKWILINYLSLSLDLKFPRPVNGKEEKKNGMNNLEILSTLLSLSLSMYIHSNWD